MKIYEFQQFILNRCGELKISIAELARRSNVSRQAMHKIMNDKSASPRLATMVAMASALEVTPICLFRHLLYYTEMPNYTSSNAKTTGDGSAFVADVTYPDNSNVPVNQKFIKIWQIQNVGTVDWENRELICVDVQPMIHVNLPAEMRQPPTHFGLKPTSQSVPIPFTPAGHTVKIAVEFTAPSYPCNVMSYWKMVNAQKEFYFPDLHGLYCHVNVIAI